VLAGVPAPPPSLLSLLNAVGVPCGSSAAAVEPLAVALGPLALKQLWPPAGARLCCRAPKASGPGDFVSADSFSLGTAALPAPAPKGLLCCCSAADFNVSTWRATRSLPSGVTTHRGACWRPVAGAAVRGVRGTLLGSASRAVRGVASGSAASAPPLLEGRLLDSGACCLPRLLTNDCCPSGVCDCCCCCCKLDRSSFGILVLDPGMGLQAAPWSCSCCCRPVVTGLLLPMPT
jgi:hypothetical protein